jgi:ribosomal-protein-alanine N-acetyltransferase
MKSASINIERASPDGAGALAELHAQAFHRGWPAKDFAASCGDDRRIVLKAELDRRLAGLLVLQRAADEAEILSLAVADGSKRRGVGTALLRTAIAACRDKMICSLFLEVAVSNLPAIHLYKKAGFEVIAHRRNYYQSVSSARETAYIMKLDTRATLTQIERQGQA